MKQAALSKVAILCGGRGTRLNERTTSIPKPLVEIGDKPILWHVMQIYLHFGVEHFVLCLGYKGEAIEGFIAESGWPADVQIECVDTGVDTPTGGRIAKVADRLAGSTFGVTYADGVADIDLAALTSFHADRGKLATVTAVRPRLPFGVMRINDDEVIAFEEKPLSQEWINGGFFCFEQGALDHIGQQSTLEREPLKSLLGDGQLVAYRHEGFWECMDTYKDAVVLNDLWQEGNAPWKVWS